LSGWRRLQLKMAVFRIPYSVFRIPYSVFRIPYSVFRIPYSIPYSVFCVLPQQEISAADAAELLTASQN